MFTLCKNRTNYNTLISPKFESEIEWNVTYLAVHNFYVYLHFFLIYPARYIDFPTISDPYDSSLK